MYNALPTEVKDCGQIKHFKRILKKCILLIGTEVPSRYEKIYYIILCITNS